MKSRFLHRVYLWGYGGGRMPRMLRRMIAGSQTGRKPCGDKVDLAPSGCRFLGSIPKGV
jgi:hypothetical protein